jgi:hypothetical protein
VIVAKYNNKINTFLKVKAIKLAPWSAILSAPALARAKISAARNFENICMDFLPNI